MHTQRRSKVLQRPNTVYICRPPPWASSCLTPTFRLFVLLSYFKFTPPPFIILLTKNNNNFSGFLSGIIMNRSRRTGMFYLNFSKPIYIMKGEDFVEFCTLPYIIKCVLEMCPGTKSIQLPQNILFSNLLFCNNTI